MLYNGSGPLPTDTQHLQRMVLAYHRFLQHYTQTAAAQQQQAVRTAEEGVRQKYLSRIAELEKTVVDLQNDKNSRSSFRLW